MESEECDAVDKKRVPLTKKKVARDTLHEKSVPFDTKQDQERKYLNQKSVPFMSCRPTLFHHVPEKKKRKIKKG